MACIAPSNCRKIEHKGQGKQYSYTKRDIYQNKSSPRKAQRGELFLEEGKRDIDILTCSERGPVEQYGREIP